MLFRTSSILQSRPCSPLPSHRPQLLVAVPNNTSPWLLSDHAPLVLSPWKPAKLVTGQIPWKLNFLTVLMCGRFWWLMSPSQQLTKCRPPHQELVDLSLGPFAGMDIGRCKKHLQTGTGSDIENGSRRKMNMLYSDWRGRWRSRADEPQQMHPFLKQMEIKWMISKINNNNM